MPEPVGAEISAWRPLAIAGQACTWAGVGAAKARANQSRTCGVKGARAGCAAEWSFGVWMPEGRASVTHGGDGCASTDAPHSPALARISATTAAPSKCASRAPQSAKM